MEAFVTQGSIVGGGKLFRCLPPQEKHSELLESWQRKRSTMGQCCFKTTNVVFFIFNHICFVLGTLIFCCGMWILSNKNPFGTVVQITAPSFEYWIYAFTAIGAITMTMGFLGCIGYFYGVHFFLCLYIFFLTLILTAQVCIGALLASQMQEVKDGATHAILDVIEQYKPDDKKNQTLRNAWDSIQAQFKCCGLNGPKDWESNIILTNEKYTFYPCSCANRTTATIGFCPVATPPPKSSSIDQWPVTKVGCMEAVKAWFNENFNIILGISIMVGIVEFFGMVISLFLCCYEKRT